MTLDSFSILVVRMKWSCVWHVSPHIDDWFDLHFSEQFVLGNLTAMVYCGVQNTKNTTNRAVTKESSTIAKILYMQ